MACLRSLDILKEIYILLQSECSDLWDDLENKPKNRIKLPACINIDGTVTVVLPSTASGEVYIRFSGNRIVELWSASKGMDVFWIEESSHTSEQICDTFRELLKSHGYNSCGNAALEDTYCKPTIFDGVQLIGMQEKVRTGTK